MSAAESESGDELDRTGVTTRKHFSELTAQELHDILELRSSVFVVEQNCVYNDIDGRDTEPETQHFWTECDGRIETYLRVLADGQGAIRIGRVVTRPTSRGQGLAVQLLKSVISAAGGAIVLDAQAQLETWYETLGFTRSGDDFIEDGIAHVPMRRDEVQDLHTTE
jgi:ElaA protein